MAGSGTAYVALLRGVNVGGKNAVKMAELRAHFEEMGFADVATYINSGNVLFRAPRRKRAELAARLEGELTRRFGIELKAVLLTEAQLRDVVDSAPLGSGGFGADTHRSDVIFIREPLTVKRAMAAIELKEGVDRAWAGKGVVYFSRLDARASSSRLNRFAVSPEYQDTTIRSWSTTTKLLGKLDENGPGG
jgi:uncharacterized protein (DUF1697 family)